MTQNNTMTQQAHPPRNLHILIFTQSKSDHLWQSYGQKTISASLRPWYWPLTFQTAKCGKC